MMNILLAIIIISVVSFFYLFYDLMASSDKCKQPKYDKRSSLEQYKKQMASKNKSSSTK
jgi:hypothetical protein